ncbi:hypothetical protein ACMFMG_011680 [Clarireedia jacksonii]
MNAGYDVGRAAVAAMRPRNLMHLSRGGFHLCAHCRQINVQTLTAPGGYQHYAQPSDMMKSSEHCPLCERFVLRPQGVLHGGNHEAATGRLSCSLVREDGLNRLQLSTETSHPQSLRNGRLVSLAVFTNEGDPAAGYGVAVRRRLSNTHSASSATLTREWLRTCREQHRCSYWVNSCRRADPLHQQPSRLLDLRSFGDDSLDVRIVQIVEASEYVALSHCWGPVHNRPCVLTCNNLAEWTCRLAFQILPLTFQDAIKITRGLGFRYLWIDALCILQDCEEDWDTEGSKMEAIFSNCALCISATSGVDSTSGCFTTNSTGRQSIEPHLIDITSILTTGETSTLVVYCDQPIRDGGSSQYLPGAIRNSPIVTRGWTLQERILPSRILHFTSEQLIWECGDGFESEDGLESWAQSVERCALGSGPMLARELANVGRIDSPFGTIYRWYTIIDEDYSKRRLSFAKDKLAAISGLARLVARNTGSRYIAGLWEFGLCYGLCWVVNAPAPLTIEPENYRSPSFSWAATNSKVSWLPGIFDLNRGPPSSLFTLLGWQCVLSTSDQYGRISQCALKITGQCMKVVVRPSPAEPWPNDSNAILGDDRNGKAWMDVYPMQEEQMLAILVCNLQEELPGSEAWNTYALLLKPIQQGRAIFKRAGLAYLFDEEFTNCPSKTIILV